MHILIFAEQHPMTLGGAQVSMLLQAKFLKRLGHTVTFVSPAKATGPVADPDFIDLPSNRIPGVREYTWIWPAERLLGIVEERLVSKPPVDLVHVQSDFWGAALGFRFARRKSLPLVYGLHNRLDVGIDSAFPFPGLLYRVLGAWQRFGLGYSGERFPRDAFGFFRNYAKNADAVVAPSKHFANLLKLKGASPANGGEIDVVPTGVDDDMIEEIRPGDGNAEPYIVWLGRFSPEKRLLEFLEALPLLKKWVRVCVIGGGRLERKAKRLAPANVEFLGSVSHREAIDYIAGATALIQSSNGFETQGMTVTEAVAVGTPVVLVDQQVAGELPAGTYILAKDDSVASLANAIDEVLLSAVKPNGSRKTVSDLNQSKLTERMLKIYERLLSR